MADPSEHAGRPVLTPGLEKAPWHAASPRAVRRGWSGALVLWLSLLAGPVFGAEVLAISDPKINQHQEALAAARQALGQAGNHTVAEVDATAAGFAERIKAHPPDLILAVGQKALLLAQEAAPNIPTVFCLALERSAKVSKTVTGVPLDIPASKQLGRFKEAYPALKRLGVLYDPQVSGPFVEQASKAAAALGLTLVTRPIGEAKELRSAVADIIPNIDALWLLPDPRIITKEVFNYLLVFTLERRTPLLGFLDSFTKAGALLSLSPDYTESGKAAGELAGEILLRPQEKRLPLPPPVYSPGLLSVNQRTAAQLGIRIPDKVLASARQLY
ncbi:MAG: hypothetical protein HY901_33355 [Deltaproteobacteria bacterium]|nr:hypothetical protein [Deltaproteobacteria bacterium]